MDIRVKVTASTSIAPIITPARYANNLRTLSQLKPSARTQGILYLGQNGRRGIGGIFIRRLRDGNGKRLTLVGPLLEMAALFILLTR